MSQWPMRPLGEVCSVIMGQSPPGDTYNADRIGLPFFQGKAEFGEEFPVPVKWCSKPNRIADAGDILMSVRAPVGPTNYATEKCCIGRGLAAIRGNEGIVHQSYIGWFLKRFQSDLAAKGVGSTFSAINRKDIESLPVPVPPLTEQERLVRLLDEAYAIRKLRAQADQRTADLIPALFHQMFGDPLTNPTGWPEHSFSSRDIIEIIDGDRGIHYPKKTDFQEDGYCLFLNTSNVRKGSFDFAKCDFIDEARDQMLRKGRLKRGDVVLTTRGTLGNSAFYGDDIRFDHVRINSGMVILRPSTTFMTPGYLLALLNSHYFRDQMSSLTSGSAQQQLPINKLHKITLPLPPVPLQHDFARSVKVISELRNSHRRSAEQVEAAARSLMQSIFNYS